RRKRGCAKSVLLAVRVTRRGTDVAIRNASTNALVWFGTRSKAPSRGTFSSPSTSTRRKNTESAIRQTACTARQITRAPRVFDAAGSWLGSRRWQSRGPPVDPRHSDTAEKESRRRSARRRVRRSYRAGSYSANRRDKGRTLPRRGDSGTLRDFRRSARRTSE